MKIVIDCDDAAIELKKTVTEHLKKSGAEVTDLDYLGSHEGAFYPEIGYNLALTIQKGEFDRGIQTGYGSMRWSNGARFEGDMQEYSPHGYGTMHYSNGVVCTGNWDSGNFLG